ncbi:MULTISPECIES: C40 family peptidase [Aquitalea]|uniref:C40 family peptidase n=1 Tax=Aquitalea TaxID=407217 RepID=UPI00135B296A|nr:MULTISPECIES: C40 family peptidase [Aquitalea]
MKLQLRLLAVMLAGVMVFAQAAPEKTAQDARPKVEASEDPIAKYASPGEDAVGDLLLQAMSLLGVAYRFGGNSPVSGLDCSGFVRYVFQKSLKVNLPRTSAEMAHIGKAVDKSELVAGDLVFFNTRGFAYSHVGMYMGNGKFIHAPRTGRNIEVVNMNQSYWQSRWNGARRINRSNVNTVAAADQADAGNDAVASPSGGAAAPKMKCRKGKKCKPVAEASASKKKGGKQAGKADKSSKPAKAGKSGHGKKKKPAN